MPLQTFRYAACGGGNTLLSILVFFLTFHFVLHEQDVHIGSYTVSAHTAAYIFAFVVTFPIGFYLSLFVVFPESYLKRRIQLFRYLVVVLLCNLFNYVILNLFVDKFNWYPTPSYILTIVIVVTFSYFSQRNFSFKAE